jgi:hypothetical protein
MFGTIPGTEITAVGVILKPSREKEFSLTKIGWRGRNGTLNTMPNGSDVEDILAEIALD